MTKDKVERHLKDKYADFIMHCALTLNKVFRAYLNQQISIKRSIVSNNTPTKFPASSIDGLI